MKRFTEMTNTEKKAAIAQYGQKTAINDKHADEKAEIAYIIANNTVEEISDWLKHNATTTYYAGTPINWFCTVYMFNRLHEYCEANG